MIKKTFWIMILCWLPLSVAAEWNGQDVAWDFMQQAMRLESGHAPEAAKIYRSLIELYPQYRDVQARSLYQLAGLYETQGKIREAQLVYAWLADNFSEQKGVQNKTARRLREMAPARSKIRSQRIKVQDIADLLAMLPPLELLQAKR